MAIDPRTLLLLTPGIVAIAGVFLLLEWRTTRERAMLDWGLGFLAIVIGCLLALLREGGFFLLGVWLADSTLIVAHILFLQGSRRFVGQAPSRAAWLALLPWVPLFAFRDVPYASWLYGTINAAMVAVLVLAAALCLYRGRAVDPGKTALRLAIVFGCHGLFYAIKTLLISLPGAFPDIAHFQGPVIAASAIEGVPAATLLTLLMGGAVRHRREAELLELARSDSLTGLLNRRAFDDRGAALLASLTPETRRGALLLFDLDHFKQVNDTGGHAAGDRILVAFADLLRALLPADALIGRHGGDEFVALLPAIEPAELSQLGAAICARFKAICAGMDAGAATSVTIGTAWMRRDSDLTRLLADADSATYEAKRRGRDRMHIREAGQPGVVTRLSA